MPTDEPAPTDEPVPSGPIWEWALGRNVWNDAALADLASSLGRTSDTNILVHASGVELDLDRAGTVIAVVLYNDEVALGLPPSNTSFSAYTGALPAGLSWKDTYDTVVQRYGNGELVMGGFGIEFTFAYATDLGRSVAVTYTASHEDQLQGSRIHVIAVRQRSQ